METNSGNIPQLINYCWFGHNPLPESAKKCIQSWRRFFPGYEIKEWNEDNFDLRICPYVEEAYKAKKWAFASDYARFWILYHYGGLYFDTDVEVIKSFDDILSKGPFMGEEAQINKNPCNPGLGLYAAPGLGLYAEILNYYDSLHFIKNDGSLNTQDTVVYHVTSILRKHGFKGDGSIENIEGIYIYPPEYFCPMNYLTLEIKITNNTRSIHHYDASWQTKTASDKVRERIKKIIGPKATEKIMKLKSKIRSS